MAQRYTDTDQFRAGLAQFSEQAHKRATRQLRRVAMKALELAVMGTPVLTGCCRANWIVSVGDLTREYNDQHFDAGGAGTIKAGLVTLSSVELGTDVFIENSCPYVVRLEYGWSRQKPPGSMIRIPLAALKTAIKQGAM